MNSRYCFVGIKLENGCRYPSQVLAHSRYSIMSCMLEFLKGTEIQLGTGLFAGTLPGCLAAWPGQKQGWAVECSILLAAFGQQGLEWVLGGLGGCSY